MITIQITENELNSIIKSLHIRIKKKNSRKQCWYRRKEAGLIIPVEVADAFITIDDNAIECMLPLINRLEKLKNGLQKETLP